MNKSVFYLLLIALWSQACNTSSSKSPKNEQYAIQTEAKHIKLGTEGKSCTIDLNYELAKSGPEKTKKIINRIIEDDLRKLLRESANTTFPTTSLTDNANSAMQHCQSINDEYYMMNLWTNHKIYPSKEGFVTISMFYEAYTGGAHPNHATQMMVLSEKTGEQLTLAKIFRDTLELTKFCETQFRNDYQLGLDTNINAEGLWFKNDKFALNNNFGFVNDTLLFWYNPYEIASFAAGDIVLKIKPEDWKKLRK